MAPVVEIHGLTKRFGALSAVEDLSFPVGRGEVLGFLGPNGAGKSTTMKMITGFLAPDAGSVRIAGRDVAREPVAVKADIGYLPEGAPLYADMTPRAFLDFIARVRGLPPARRGERIAEVVETVHLAAVLDQPIETLSKGFKRRVGLAQAILHDPGVLILDEPTDGLDPNQKSEVRELISRMAADKAIVISTHLLEEVETVCTRAAIISRGRIVLDGAPEELMALSRYHNAVSLRVAAPRRDAAREALAAIDGVGEVEVAREDGAHAVLLAVPEDGAQILAEIGARARSGALEADEIVAERGRLDEVFRRHTAGE